MGLDALAFAGRRTWLLTGMILLAVEATFGADPNPDRLKPDYQAPYGIPRVTDIIGLLERVRGYLATNSPAGLEDGRTHQSIHDLSQPNPDAVLRHGTYAIISYEWGVTYDGMMQAAQCTGDARFDHYVRERMTFIGQVASYFKKLGDEGLPPAKNPLRSVLYPHALDDAGSMCAAMIRAQRAGLASLQPWIDIYGGYISTNQYRLADRTLARQRPMPDSVWMDDLYMSVPALAQMGTLTGKTSYYDDAIRQVLQFSARTFDPQKNLYRHGWVAGMKDHPSFFWGRANGWAILAMADLLDNLPAKYPGREKVLECYQGLARGLAACQGPNGMWHQLLDRSDSYTETSASALFTYGMARGIDHGWLDPLPYGPVVVAAWNGLSTRVNEQGQVTGTCVATTLAFDPAYYYARPCSVYAAHGYGPMLLAGSEMIRLLQSHDLILNGGVEFGRPGPQ